ncbi:MAG: acyloxyacyl hydrolase [Acidobacteriota bacterium]|nr:acyloxyacyl hydrolase [Acidobacteriota bacterium]
MRRFLLLALSVAALASFAAAQTQDEMTLRRGSRELGAWASGSGNSLDGIGKATARRFYELNGQFAYTVFSGHGAAVKWVSEVTPAALLHEPHEWYLTKGDVTGYRAGATTYGFGATPLGLQVNFRNGHRVQPFFDAHGGMLYFMRQEPVPGSSQFNFTFNFGTGAQVYLSPRGSLLAGFKYHHISNNETAPENPGVDSAEWYAGYLWRWKK